MFSDRGKVLGNYAEEMKRRVEDGRRYLRKDPRGVLFALGLVAFGAWPLGFWHAAALVGGLVWAFCISEGTTHRLADELDLLEGKLAARLAEMK